MTVFLRDFDAWIPQDFCEQIIASLIQHLQDTEDLDLEKLLEVESGVYEGWGDKIESILGDHCDPLIDEVESSVYDKAYDEGQEYGWDRGYEVAQGELDDETESLRQEIQELEENIELLENQISNVDIDEIRDAVKADLFAELNTAKEDYYD